MDLLRVDQNLLLEILFNDRSKLLLTVVYRPPNSGYLNKFFQSFLEFSVNYRHSLGSFIFASSLYLIPFMSTHHLRNSSTLLDLCSINVKDKLKEFGQRGVAFLSAHNLIFVSIVGRVAVCRDSSGFDASSFQSDVDDIDWTDIEIFGIKLLNIFNAHVPLKRYFKNLPAPWLTNKIRLMMRNRDLARRIGAGIKMISYDRYKTLRNKAQYLMLRLSHFVEELNAFFGHNAECADCMKLGSLGEILPSDFDDRSFHWNYVVSRDIVISRTKSNAVGEDSISLRLLKLTTHIIMSILEHLFNFSLMNGVYSVKWKSAFIYSNPKVRNPTLVQHYRPISILPTLSKTLEQIVCAQIRVYLKNSGLYDPCQSTYPNNHSTQTCLIRMLDEVSHAADRRMVTVSVFFDFSKAFDRRTQAVKDSIKGTTSSLSLVRIGMPDGSVLGPFHFTLYLADFRLVVRHCKYNFYADNLRAYIHCEPRDLPDTIRKVNED
ncbi:hypothetical protein ACFW04_011954 [Cataglyphis niger]